MLRPYKDQVGKLTIGVGHLIQPGESFGDHITKEQAGDLLARDVARFEAAIAQYIKVELNQNQFDALTSLCFNCGVGPLLGGVGKALNAGDYATAADRFLEWRNAGGKPILLSRRQRERALFIEPIAQEPIATTMFDLRSLVDITPHREDA